MSIGTMKTIKRSTYLFPIKFALYDYRFRPHIRAIGIFFRVLGNMRILAPKSISTPLGANEKRCWDTNASKWKQEIALVL